MNDFAVSISRLIPESNDVEKFRVWNKLRDQATLRFETSAIGTSDGAGTWLTLWSGTVPEGASVGTNARVIGRGTSKGVLFEIACGFQNFAGTTSFVGATFSIVTNLTDDALFDVRWSLTGSVASLQVNDGSVQALNWTAFLSSITTV